MTEHTPGPWEVDRDERSAAGAVTVSVVDGYWVATCYERDANLIVAAPDMYEVLILADLILRTTDHDMAALGEKVASVLAKARGTMTNSTNDPVSLESK